LLSHHFCFCLFHQTDLLLIKRKNLADVRWERQKDLLGDEIHAGLLARNVCGKRGLVVHTHVETREWPQERPQLDDAFKAIPRGLGILLSLCTRSLERDLFWSNQYKDG